MAKAIFNHFEKKFLLGELGVVESVCISSLYLKNQKPFSLIVISPSGQMKSSIMRDITNMFPEHVTVIPSRHTPYGLSGMEKLKWHTWLNNDMVRTFSGISKTKIEEIVGFYTELLTEGTSSSATARPSIFKDIRMNMIGNIALKSYSDVKDKFVTTTFNERILQVNYAKDKNDIRYKTLKNFPLSENLKNIMLANRLGDGYELLDIVLSKKQKKEVYRLSDKLCNIALYEEGSMRPDEIVESFICAYALLNNNRPKLKKSDFDVFEKLIPFFRRVV
jgi:hypothetical protein